MKNILLLGAGRSATALIDYLLEQAPQHNWAITIGDMSVEHLEKKLAQHQHTRSVVFNVFNDTQRSTEVQQASLVISLLPAAFHIHVAKECLAQRRHLITASYVSPEIKALHEEAKTAGLIFLMESGLDPGIDHMSAMAAINHIRQQGGELTSFKSFTGGLIAPESDTNPWHYKFTWNPRNVVVAGQGVAKYLENGAYKYIPYHQLFRRTETLHVLQYGEFDGYANRDSISYRQPYGLQDIPTILRGTLRRKGYCEAWNLLVQLGMTDDSYQLENSAAMTNRQFTEAFLPATEPGADLATAIASYLRVEADSEAVKKLEWLGLFDDTAIGLNNATPAQVLEKILTAKWKLEPGDKDMIVMQHLFEYNLNGRRKQLTSSMVVLGDDEIKTGMAKTVGLPVGIAARLIMEGSISQRGVVIPIEREFYEPILEALQPYGITFVEEEKELE